MALKGYMVYIFHLFHFHTHIHDRNTQTKGRKEVLNSNYPLKEQKAKKVRIK